MITIVQECSPLMPGYNELIYLVNSSNKSQANFKYVCDVYVAGVKVDRLDTPPHPSYGTGMFNPSRIIESYISKDIAMTDTGITHNPNSYINYQLRFGESYGASSSGVTVYADMTLTGQKYIWNGVYDYQDACVYSSGDIIAAPSNNTKFQTNKPSSGDIEIDDNSWLYWCNFNLDTDYAKIITRNSSLATIGTWKVSLKTAGLRFLRMPTGINMNSIASGSLSLGVQPILTGTEHSYSIQIFDSSNRALTELYYYTIVSNCSKYTKTRLQFLNKKGGYDFFDFNKVSKWNSDIEKYNYKKSLGSYTSSTSFAYNVNDRANTQFHTKIKDKITLESDWVTEAQMIWLEELLTSPDVYLENGTSLIPINITNTSFERKKQVNKHLFNLQIEYTFSYDRYRQRF